jgi:hypothetical protein
VWSGRCRERADADEDLGEQMFLGRKAQDQGVGVADQPEGTAISRYDRLVIMA